MIVVIDGYNLLKQLFPGKNCSDKQRNIFIRQLGYYKIKKTKEIKEIIVVFDAGPFAHASREIKNGVTIIFSGQKSNADNWIIEFVERKKNEELLIITMDRRLIEACGRGGARALSSLDFYHVMQKCILDGPQQQSPQSMHAPLKKYGLSNTAYDLPEINSIDQCALDLLMEQESFGIIEDNYEEPELNTKNRKGCKVTFSKKEKKAYTTIKKLR